MYGLVLAGGKSSRLGQDKTALNYEGRTLLQRTAALLQEHCDKVFISTRNPEMVCAGCEVILDATERIGPLGGIATALDQVGGPLLVLACDLPFMHSSVLQRLIEARNSRPAGTVLTAYQQEQTGFIEALVAIYERDALPMLQHGINERLYKLSLIIPDQLRHTLRYGPELADSFFNVNYPHDLQRMLQTGNSEPQLVRTDQKEMI